MARAKRSPINIRLYIGLFVILIAGSLTYNYLSVQANKRNFKQARSTIDSVYSEIVKTLGPSDANSKASHCGGSQCTVSTSFVYGVENKSTASYDFHKIQKIIKNHKKFIPSGPLATDLTALSNGFTNARDLYSNGGLSCAAQYTYDPPQAIPLKVKDSSAKPFYVEIGCTGHANHQYY